MTDLEHPRSDSQCLTIKVRPKHEQNADVITCPKRETPKIQKPEMLSTQMVVSVKKYGNSIAEYDKQ
jgi:hypothetical protein